MDYHKHGMMMKMIMTMMRCDDVFWINSNIKSTNQGKGGWDTLRAISGLAEPASDYINDQHADFGRKTQIISTSDNRGNQNQPGWFLLLLTISLMSD